MKHLVPYYSQYLNIENPFWMLRACGMTSLQMVLEFFGAEKASLESLCEDALKAGGYDMKNGWMHDYLVSYAKEKGFECERKEGLVDIKEIANHLQKVGPVIVSVEKRVLEQRRFHMLVITGYELDAEGDISSFYYHEPESTTKENGEHRKCSKAVFLEYWRSKAIFVSPRTV